MNKVEIKVGDYIFNKDDVAKGNSTILFRADRVSERVLERVNEETGDREVYARETLVSAYCLATGNSYSIEVRHDKNEWAVVSAETMRVLCQ